MELTDADFQTALDLVGVFVFALSGGLVAVRKGFDIVGVLVLAWLAGLGGGMVRDVLIGAVPPVGISDWRVMAAAASAGLITFVLHPGLARISRSVRVLDAVGLAFFAVAGSMKALDHEVGPLASIVVGVITATGGGLLRDLLAGLVPEVLRRELYAIPALIGATTIVVADALDHLSTPVVWGTIMVVFTIRMLAVRLALNAPRPLRTGESP